MVQVEVEGAEDSFRYAGTATVESLPKISSRTRRIEESRIVQSGKSSPVFGKRAENGDRADRAARAVERRRSPQ